MEGNKKWIALVVVIVIIAGCIGGYMYYMYKRTPAYSLKIIETSVKEHNWEHFKRHVDVKEISESAFDDLTAATMGEDTSVDSGMKTLAAGFIQMFKPVIVNALQDGIKEFVETGTREKSKAGSQSEEKSKEEQGNQVADNLLKGIRAEETKFTGIKSTETEGATATVTLGLRDEKLDADYDIKLRMNQLDDGTWRLSKISNLKELYKSVQAAKKRELDSLNASIKSEIDSAVQIGDMTGNVSQEDSLGFSYELILSADAKINSGKPLSSFSGYVSATDPSGEITKIYYNYETDTRPGGPNPFHQEIVLSKHLNPFIPSDSDMIEQKGQGYTFKASVTEIKYQDGKEVKLLTELPDYNNYSNSDRSRSKGVLGSGDNISYAKDSVGNVIRNKQGKAVANVDKYGNELRDDTVLGKFINGAGRELSNAFFGSKHNYITDANGNAIISRNIDGSIKYDENGNPVYIDKGPSTGFFSNLIEWVDYGFKTTGKWLISSNSNSNSTSNSTSNNNSNHTSNENSYVSNKPKLDPNITYKEVVLDKQTLYKLGYNPADRKNFTSVKIPYTFEFKGNHYKITKVGEKAFYNYGALQKVTIEEGVQILGVSAFENCTALTTVNLPSSINKINNNAFANCKALKNINLPYGITELRDSLFYNNISLSSIEIPSSVTKIGDMVFYKCKSLKSISIPSGVTSIGQSAFAGCRGITKLEIPSSIEKIGQWAFSNCVSVSHLTVPDTVSSIGEEAFANIGYVYYDGSASGQPWGALDSNKVPVFPFTLDELFLGDYFELKNKLGEPDKIITETIKVKGHINPIETIYIPVACYGDSSFRVYIDKKERVEYVGIHCIISEIRNGIKTGKGIQVGDPESKLLEKCGSELHRHKNNYFYDYDYYASPNDRCPEIVCVYYEIKNERVSRIFIQHSGQHAVELDNALFDLVLGYK